MPSTDSSPKVGPKYVLLPQKDDESLLVQKEQAQFDKSKP